MRARARRLVVLLVSIEIPFPRSVKRWNDSRTPRHLCAGVSGVDTKHFQGYLVTNVTGVTIWFD
jgi:hypothetical protein